MKKTAIFFLILFTAFVACKKEESDAEQSTDKNQTSQFLSVPDSTIQNVSRLVVPTLRDSVNNVLLQQYKSYTQDYLRAMKAKDEAKVESLQASAQEWSDKTKRLTNKLSSEELQAVNDFMQQLSTELNAVK